MSTEHGALISNSFFIYVELIIALPVPTVNLTIHQQNFVKKGGSVELTCTVTSVASVDLVTWYHDNASIVSDLPEWQSKDRICSTRETENCVIETKFSLKIRDVGLSNSGYYTCSPPSLDVEPGNVYVLIIDRKYHMRHIQQLSYIFFLVRFT